MTLHFVCDGDPDIEEAWQGNRCFIVIRSEQGDCEGYVVKFPKMPRPLGVMEYSCLASSSMDEVRQQLEQYAGSLPHK